MITQWSFRSGNTYITSLENVAFLLWYVISPSILAGCLTRWLDVYALLPDYAQKVPISFATNTAWAYARKGAQPVRPDFLLLQFLNDASLPMSSFAPLLTYIGVLCTSGAVAGGVLRWLDRAQPWLAAYIRLPGAYRVIFGRMSAIQGTVGWVMRSLKLYDGFSAPVRRCFYSELCFSFLSGYAYLVLSQLDAAPNQIRIVTGGNMNRWVSSTLVFIGHLSNGYRPMLQIAYAALVAAFYGNPSIFVICSLANTLGLYAAATAFQLERYGGLDRVWTRRLFPIHLVLEPLQGILKSIQPTRKPPPPEKARQPSRRRKEPPPAASTAVPTEEEKKAESPRRRRPRGTRKQSTDIPGVRPRRSNRLGASQLST